MQYQLRLRIGFNLGRDVASDYCLHHNPSYNEKHYIHQNQSSASPSSMDSAAESKNSTNSVSLQIFRDRGLSECTLFIVFLWYIIV